MSTVTDDLDRVHLAEAAKEVLERPDNYGTTDPRRFVTHGVVMQCPERDIDILAESNYQAALARLNGAVAWDESGDSEARGDDVVDTNARHRGVGSLRQLFVRVYVPGFRPWEVDYDDARVQYTPAFVEAVAIADRLRKHPILDESDYSERERKAWESEVEEAVESCEHSDDGPADRQAIWQILYYGTPDGTIGTIDEHPDWIQQFGYPEVEWDLVDSYYQEARDLYYETRTQAQLSTLVWPAEYRRPYPGQEPLPGI